MRLRLGLACLGAVALASIGRTQNPDIEINFDGRLQFLTQTTGPTFVRFYDNLGRHSVGSIKFFTEIGFQGYVSQKLARIPGDPDRDSLDEYYLEDEGNWRIGKQYLPFGAGRLMRESVLAVRGDTQLIVEGLPIVLAACDNGQGRQRGVVGRLGSRIGLSFAFGSHFGINATAFTLVRRPEESPGVGRGYKTVIGIDYSKNAGSFFDFGGELVIVRDGNTEADRDDAIFDVHGTLKADRRKLITLGWTRDNGKRADFYRAMGEFVTSKLLSVEPMIRYKGSTLFDVSLTLHFKL